MERKRWLQALLRHAPEGMVCSAHMRGDSEQIVRQACEFGLEGIVSKRIDSPYRSGRQESC